MCINIDFSVNICLVDNVCVPLVMLKIRNFSSSSFKSQLGQGIVDMFVSTCRWCLCSMVQKNNNKLCCIPRSWDPDVTDSVSQNRQYLMSTTSAYKSMFLLWTMFFFFFAEHYFTSLQLLSGHAVLQKCFRFPLVALRS